MFTWCCSKLCLNEPSYMHVTIPALLRCVWFSCLRWSQRMIHLILLHVTSVHMCCPSYRESTYIWFIGRTRFYSYFLRERKGFKWANGSRELSAHQVNKAAAASTPRQEAESEQEVRRLCVLQQSFPRDILAPVNLPLLHLPKQHPSQLGPSIWDVGYISHSDYSFQNQKFNWYHIFFLRYFCYFWKFRPTGDQQTQLPVWKITYILINFEQSFPGYRGNPTSDFITEHWIMK